jgi:hypothetical protein
MTSTWGSPVSGAWTTVSPDYDAKGEIVEVSQTLKIWFSGSISEEDLRNKIVERLRQEENVEPIYVEVTKREVEISPLGAAELLYTIFDVKYQYRSKGLIIEIIIAAIVFCILTWLGIQLVEKIQETIKVMPEPIKAAVTAGGVALALFALYLLISAVRRKE